MEKWFKKGSAKWNWLIENRVCSLFNTKYQNRSCFHFLCFGKKKAKQRMNKSNMAQLHGIGLWEYFAESNNLDGNNVVCCSGHSLASGDMK